MATLKYFIKVLLKIFMILLVIMSVFVFYIFYVHLLIDNNICKLAYSSVKNIQNSLSLINLSSVKNDNHEIITIIESYDSHNMDFSKSLVFYFSFFNDSIEYLKNFPGFASILSEGTNADIVFSRYFGSRFRILDGSVKRLVLVLFVWILLVLIFFQKILILLV